MNPENEMLTTTQEAPRQPYTPPAVISELELETRAGSPLGLPEDPLGSLFPGESR